MTTATLGQLIEKHGFDLLDHLDRDLEIPVHAGGQVIDQAAEAVTGWPGLVVPGPWAELPFPDLNPT